MGFGDVNNHHLQGLAHDRPRDYSDLADGWHDDRGVREAAYVAWHHPGGRALVTGGLWTRRRLSGALPRWASRRFPGSSPRYLRVGAFARSARLRAQSSTRHRWARSPAGPDAFPQASAPGGSGRPATFR